MHRDGYHTKLPNGLETKHEIRKINWTNGCIILRFLVPLFAITNNAVHQKLFNKK